LVSGGRPSEPASAQPLPEGETDWRGVLFGLAVGVLAAYQQFKLPPTLPLLLERYAYDRTLAGGFMSIYAVAGLLLSVPVGRLLARRGPRGLLIAAFGLFLAGNALALAAPWSGVLMLGSRMLEGLGFAIAAVVGAVVTTTSAALRHRPIAVALWATWIPLGQVVGTLFAIPSVSVGSWRPLWWVSAAGTLALALWGAHLSAEGGPSLRAPAGTSGAPASAPPNAYPERRGLLLLVSGLFGLWSAQYISYVTWLPQYLVEAHGFAPGAAARAYLVPSVLVIVANLGAGVLMRWGWGLGLLLVGSTAVQALVWFLIPLTRSTAEGLLSLTAYGIAAGITATCIFALPGALYGVEARRGFGAMMAGRNLGVLFGPVLLAQVVAAAGGWRPIPALFGTVTAVNVLLAAYVCRRIALLPES
jgi:predicted MFS family arabinose efflux permease